MAFKLVKRNTVRVHVKGTTVSETGEEIPFDYYLDVDRLDQNQIDANNKKDQKIAEFFREHARGWSGVLDAQGEPMPFSADNLCGELFAEAGMRAVAFGAYLNAVLASAKN